MFGNSLLGENGLDGNRLWGYEPRDSLEDGEERVCEGETIR
jgi:hypothetical protein